MEIIHEDGRFYVRSKGGESELRYRIESRVVHIYHTFVPESERGSGIAGLLTVAALDWARSKGFRVKPDCSYVKGFLEKHGEYDDIVDW